MQGYINNKFNSYIEGQENLQFPKELGHVAYNMYKNGGWEASIKAASLEEAKKILSSIPYFKVVLSKHGGMDYFDKEDFIYHKSPKEGLFLFCDRDLNDPDIFRDVFPEYVKTEILPIPKGVENLGFNYCFGGSRYDSSVVKELIQYGKLSFFLFNEEKCYYVHEDVQEKFAILIGSKLVNMEGWRELENNYWYEEKYQLWLSDNNYKQFRNYRGIGNKEILRFYPL